MRRVAKVKLARIPSHRTARCDSAMPRRACAAWLDTAEIGLAFSAARTASQRVRVGLVLRSVGKGRISERSVAHAFSPR